METDKTSASDLKFFFAPGEDSDLLQQKLSDFFPGLIYVYDPASKKLNYINKKVTELLGYSYEEIDEWEDALTSLVFKDDAHLVKDALKKYHGLKDDEEYSYDSRLNRKIGDWRYYKTSGTVLRRDEKGKIASLLFIAQDITDKLKTTEEIHAISALLKDTEELLHFGTWSYDVATGKPTVSDGLYQLMGFSKKETIPEITREFYVSLVAEDDIEALQNKVLQAIQNKTGFSHQYKLNRKDGKEIHVVTKGKIVIDEKEKLQKIIGITCDITEQVNAQKSLVEYKQSAIEREKYLGYGSWEMDVKSGKNTWSEGMYRLFGYDPFATDLPEPDRLYIKHMHYDYLQHGKKLMDDFIQNDVLEQLWDNEIVLKDGSHKLLETYAKKITNADNEVIKIVGTTRDVTQLKKYQQSLEIKIQELNRSNRDLEEFAYVASHDLHEPLRKLSTFSQRLADRFKDQLGEEGKNYTNRIIVATENMRALIDNLLDYSRIATSFNPHEKVNINNVIQKVLSELQEAINESNAEITVDEMPVVEGMSSQIQQLFTNLLNNALKFRKKDVSPQISISSESINNNEITNVSLPLNARYYKITIQDNGIGFEQEYAERIFQMFQRLHGKVEYPGTGVGLAICKKIVQNHHGVIFAESEMNKGAVFIVYLPENQPLYD